MESPVEIVFRYIPRVKHESSLKRLRLHLAKQASQLERQIEGLESLRIVMGLPYQHRYLGNPYDFQLEVSMCGEHITVSRKPSADGRYANVYAMIKDVFEEMLSILRAHEKGRKKPLPEYGYPKPYFREDSAPIYSASEANAVGKIKEAS